MPLVQPIHDKPVTKTKTRQSLNNSSAVVRKLAARDKRNITCRQSKVKPKPKEQCEDFADGDSDCKIDAENEENFDWDSDEIEEEEELTDRERRIKEIFISHKEACRDAAELFVIMATVSGVTNVFSLKGDSKSKPSADDSIKFFADPKGDLFICRTVYNMWACERAKDKQIWCDRFNVSNKTMYTIQKRIEEWFPNTCSCSFLQHKEELEEMNIDPDKLHKELIIQSEWNLKVWSKSICKPVTFHVENSDKILNWENGNFENLFKKITKMVSGYPKMVVYLKTRTILKIYSIIQNCLLEMQR